MKTLILGGVRSGKSRLAERLAAESGLEVVYVATAAVANDAEMRQRIAEHQKRRPREWRLVEEPYSLADVLTANAAPGRCLLVDCLTLWLTNLLCAEKMTERDQLLHTVDTLSGKIIFVGNETGMGVVPMGELSRRFCDEAGRLHQDLAQLCDRVVLTIAGLPHVLKGEPL